jgi:hypothetical protein
MFIFELWNNVKVKPRYWCWFRTCVCNLTNVLTIKPHISHDWSLQDMYENSFTVFDLDLRFKDKFRPKSSKTDITSSFWPTLYVLLLGHSDLHFMCFYVMASRTRTRPESTFLQTSSSQKLQHLGSWFFAGMCLGVSSLRFVHEVPKFRIFSEQEVKYLEKKQNL